jgi:hypothetical protein
MNQDELNAYGDARCAEVSAPLLEELRDGLELDLDDHDSLASRMLGDFAARMFEAGCCFGGTEAIAQVLERYPGLDLVVAPPPPAGGRTRLGD